MAFQNKCLWAQFITDASVQQVKDHVVATGANILCLRTETPNLTDLMTYMHGRGGKIYGWIWPHSSEKDNDPTDPSYAPNEANKVVGLIGQGLDGYMFDIETDENGSYTDWGSRGPANRASLLHNMALDIATAFSHRATPYVLGYTGHQRAFSNYPDLPLQKVLDFCNSVFPQTYWRADQRNQDTDPKLCNPVSDDYSFHPPKPIGTPDQALANGFTDYANKKDMNGNLLPIIPIAGEIGCMKAGEMTRFAQLVAQRGVSDLHFYVDVADPGWIDPTHLNDPSVLAEIKNIPLAASAAGV